MPDNYVRTQARLTGRHSPVDFLEAATRRAKRAGACPADELRPCVDHGGRFALGRGLRIGLGGFSRVTA